MEVENKTSNGNALSIEQEETNVGPEVDAEVVSASAHAVGQDSWQKVGLLLVTSFNCGYIMSFSSLILVPLGWIWGSIVMAVLGLWIAYASWLLASFHIIDGKRFIRYRDIMGYTYGRKMYILTWVYQSMALFLFNVGFVLLAGAALKELHSLISDSPLRLQYFIIVSGACFFLFSFCFPTMSAMGMWLGISFVLTSIYTVGSLVLMIKNGISDKDKNYELLGSKADKISNAFGAVSSAVVINSAGLLPEVQSTLRKPAVKNMNKALFAQFTVGLLFYYGVTIVGYWAYGSSVSWYLPLNMLGPKWVKVLINITTVFQSIVSQNMFAAPVHEALDTRFLKLDQSLHSRENIGRLFLNRAIFFTATTFIPAIFPFMGDFVNLVGSFTIIPLTFVFPSLVFIKVKRKTSGIGNNIWHLFNVILFSLLAVAAFVSSMRLIIKDVNDYNVFADL